MSKDTVPAFSLLNIANGYIQPLAKSLQLLPGHVELAVYLLSALDLFNHCCTVGGLFCTCAFEWSFKLQCLNTFDSQRDCFS